MVKGILKIGLVFIVYSAFSLTTTMVYAGPIIDVNDEAYLQIDMQAQVLGMFRDTGSGENGSGDTTDFTLRRGRLGFYGVLDDTWGMALRIEYSGDQRIGPLAVTETSEDNFYLYEAFVFADVTEWLKFRAGKTRIHITREGMESCFAPLSSDRSHFVYTPFQRLRDIGLVTWGNLMDGKIQYRLGISEGREDVDAPKSTFRYSARAHISLWDPEDQYSYQATYLENRKVLTLGAGIQYEPDVVYGNVAAKTLEKDYFAWTLDAFLEYPFPLGTVSVFGSFLETDFDDAYKGGDPDAGCTGIDGQKKGTIFRFGYLLPRPAGPGRIQFFCRYETWKFAALFDTYNQKIDWFGGGINYLIKGQDIRITLEYANNDYEKTDGSQNTEDFDTITTMLQFRF